MKAKVYFQCIDDIGDTKTFIRREDGVQITPSFDSYYDLTVWLRRLNFMDKAILIKNMLEEV